MVASTLLLLTACGGGGGIPTVSDTGYVGDGYIEGAYVCHDSDGDWDCLDETYATTGVDGSFMLSNYDPTIDLIVQIPAGSVDNGPFADGSTTPRPFTTPVWYVYPAGVAPQSGPIFVGPLSTLVAAQIGSMPGATVADAVGILGTQMGVDPIDLLGNYLDNNITTTSGTSMHFVAEITGSALNSSSTATGTDYDAVLADVGSIVSTATSNNPISYDTDTYPTPTSNAGNTVALMYQGVADIHADLMTCYYGFESWDMSNSNEHKKLCLTTDVDTGAEKLNITEHHFVAPTWTLDQMQSSGYMPYMSNPEDTLIDMTKVNHATEDYIHPYRLLPATLDSYSGAGAVFDSNGFKYKLIVSEADINALSGAVLPQGPTLDALVDPLTFGTGDKIYKAVAISQNKTYTVDNQFNHFSDTTTVGTMPRNYIVFEEGTMGGAAFAQMVNTQDINAMVQLTDTDFIIDYIDSDNFTKISISTPYNSAVAINMCQVEHIVAGSNGGTIGMASYTVETHNGTPFFVIQNYNGPSSDLFIGKITAIDGSSFVYGQTNPANVSHDLTEGGYQDGDIMDDMMLNQSARDRVLNSVSAPLVLP
jgi:hypothetical protein